MTDWLQEMDLLKRQLALMEQRLAALEGPAEGETDFREMAQRTLAGDDGLLRAHNHRSKGRT